MGKKEADPNAELDEDGLIIQKYLSTVLLVVPPREYAETTMRYARSALYNVAVHARAVSTNEEELLPGTLQDEFQADGVLAGESMQPYTGLLICGGPGALALADDPDLQRLTRECVAQDKLLGAWGEGVRALVTSGVLGSLKRPKVTGAPELEADLVRAGARYTGTQVQVHGKLVTGLDDSSGLRFGKALVQVVAI